MAIQSDLVEICRRIVDGAAAEEELRLLFTVEGVRIAAPSTPRRGPHVQLPTSTRTLSPEGLRHEQTRHEVLEWFRKQEAGKVFSVKAVGAHFPRARRRDISYACCQLRELGRLERTSHAHYKLV